MSDLKELQDRIKYLEAENEYLKSNCEIWNELHQVTMMLLREAKNKYSHNGRPKKVTELQTEEIKQYRAEGKTIKEIANILNCSTSTVNRRLKELSS